MQNEIEEIRTDFVDDQNLKYIDCFFKGTEEGKTIAVVDLDTNKVIFFDNFFRLNSRVLKEIDNIRDKNSIK